MKQLIKLTLLGIVFCFHSLAFAVIELDLTEVHHGRLKSYGGSISHGDAVTPAYLIGGAEHAESAMAIQFTSGAYYTSVISPKYCPIGYKDLTQAERLNLLIDYANEDYLKKVQDFIGNSPLTDSVYRFWVKCLKHPDDKEINFKGGMVAIQTNVVAPPPPLESSICIFSDGIYKVSISSPSTNVDGLTAQITMNIACTEGNPIDYQLSLRSLHYPPINGRLSFSNFNDNASAQIAFDGIPVRADEPGIILRQLTSGSIPLDITLYGTSIMTGQRTSFGIIVLTIL